MQEEGLPWGLPEPAVTLRTLSEAEAVSGLVSYHGVKSDGELGGQAGPDLDFRIPPVSSSHGNAESVPARVLALLQCLIPSTQSNAW